MSNDSANVLLRTFFFAQHVCVRVEFATSKLKISRATRRTKKNGTHKANCDEEALDDWGQATSLAETKQTTITTYEEDI